VAFDRIARGTALLALLAVTALAVPATKAADSPTPRALRSYAIPGHGVLELDVPVIWKSSLDQPPGGRPPTITFQPATTQEFELKVTANLGPHRPCRCALSRSDSLRRPAHGAEAPAYRRRGDTRGRVTPRRDPARLSLHPQ